MQEFICSSTSEMAPVDAVLTTQPPHRWDNRNIAFCDPLAPDSPSDATIELTDRQLVRLVFIAAETGSRFARERSQYDPAAWMAAPRKLFEGRNAITACLDRTMFMRAIVLHGATAVYDMAPQEMAELLSAPDQSDGEITATIGRSGPNHLQADVPLMKWSPTLFTATFAEQSATGALHVFFATMANDESAVREQLRERLGSQVSSMSTVKAGFDPSQPVAISLLSEAMAFLLSQIALEPTSALAAGFNVLIEHRFED